MPEKPFLIFPTATVEVREKPRRPVPGICPASPDDQQRRLDEKFRRIADSFQELDTALPGAPLEQVIVFETFGDVANLAKAAENVEGLEWLAELDFEDAEPEYGFEHEKDASKMLPHRLFAVMSNERVMSELLSLWDQWKSDPDKQAARGFGPFKNIFIQLKDVRRWNHEDRLRETGVLEDWQLMLEHRTDNVRFEIELWHREDSQARGQASAEVRQLIGTSGGRVLDEAAIPEIRYHGMLVEVPAQEVSDLISSLNAEAPVELVRCEAVMFFRPHGQARFSLADLADTEAVPTTQVAEAFTKEPVVAVLDGLPLEKHQLLDGRLIIDDPDVFSAKYEAGAQQHGTAMASLLCHGERDTAQPALGSPVYVRPIMHQDQAALGELVESTPADRLLVDLIHRAVRRIKEGDGEEEAVAPSVRIINLSIGDRSQPFIRDISPLAKLLDWLAWKYKLLFVVSAGNCSQPIELGVSEQERKKLASDELTPQTIVALTDDQLDRRLLAPADAMNAITVGSVHADASDGGPVGSQIDPFNGERLPSPINPVAAGFRRVVCPDVLFPGGRQLYLPDQTISAAERSRLNIVSPIRKPGQRVAVPGVRGLELNREAYTRGTSNAAALASRCAAMINDRLVELRAEDNWDFLSSDRMTVLVKALLVHGSSWEAAGERLDSILRPLLREEIGDAMKAANQTANLLTRFLGYGEVDTDRCLFCTDERLTFLAADSISDEQGHVYEMPLPPALASQRVRRRLTVTLAWLTPPNFQHRDYRRARLWIDSLDDGTLRVETANVGQDRARRGTVEHRILEGNSAVAFGDDAVMRFKVNCKAQAGRLDEVVPYGLAVSLEVAEPLEVSIYEQVRTRVRARVM